MSIFNRPLSIDVIIKNFADTQAQLLHYADQQAEAKVAALAAADKASYEQARASRIARAIGDIID